MNCYRPELLAPAGNFNKLKLAFYYGADAVYVAGKNFSLRSHSENFSDDELLEAVKYTHSLGKKIYVAVNIYAKNSDLEDISSYIKFINQANVDAMIISDPGVFYISKLIAPSLSLHLSTQANTLNRAAVRFWKSMGFDRIILARELTLDDIADIHKNDPDIELEMFVHGSMCVSYSGRCLLSNFFTHRDGNKGDCAQVCRWNFKLSDPKNPDLSLNVDEDEKGTYFMNSKDLNLISDLPFIIDAGVASLKIEGRMKTEFYLATVINTYNRALTEFSQFGYIPNLYDYESELLQINHRDYTKGFFGNEEDDSILHDCNGTEGFCDFVALVLGYEDGNAIVEMRNRFKTGDTLEILSPSESFGKSFEVGEIIDSKGNILEDVKLVQQIVKFKSPEVSAGDMLRRHTSHP
ncbi:MAG: U32 family peptidase [Christensenellaceae bacterium]|nr:U32 family peptidase [Christensenellaceae bacterium]